MLAEANKRGNLKSVFSLSVYSWEKFTVVKKKYACAMAVRFVFKKMTVLTKLSWNESQITCLHLLTLPEVQKQEWNSAVGVRKKSPNKNKTQNSVLKTS